MTCSQIPSNPIRLSDADRRAECKELNNKNNKRNYKKSNALFAFSFDKKIQFFEEHVTEVWEVVRGLCDKKVLLSILH